jgi:voltage-gated potassium channel Kch
VVPVAAMKPTVRERLRYAFDNSMAKGTRALIAWLAVVTFLMMVVYAIVVIAFGIMPEEVADKSFVETLWYALMRAMDAGALGGDAGSWPFLLTNFAITLGGIFVVSALIGVLNAGLEARIDEMRKGRSKVIESDHVLILGFTSAIDTVLSELTIANENARDACVVILSERDKVEMEDELRARVPDTGRVRVVCRSGNPADPIDLDMVNVQGTKSIIVLSPEDEDPDITVIKAILAITNAPNRRAEPYHIVAAVKDEKNVAVAKMVGKAEVSVVLIGDLISRITVQTCRQSGLSVVHTELLDFDGDEIYIAEAPELVGKTLGEALFLYPESAVIGIRTSEGPRVLPPLDTRIQKGDRIIAISRDDDTLVASTDAPKFDAALIVEAPPKTVETERTLVLGFSDGVPAIVRGLDAYVAPGSYVLIVADSAEVSHVEEAIGPLVSQRLEVRTGDTTDRSVLESTKPETFDHILVMCSDDLPAQRADARVLVTLLHLREMGERLNLDFSIVSEMRDVRNRQLAEITQADDFIVSEKLVSLMMCQTAENADLYPVLMDLFDPDGAEIYLKPMDHYVQTGQAMTFHTVVEAARRRGEIAIGYRIAAKSFDASQAYGVVVNPKKADAITFTTADKVIVVSES